MTEMKKVNIPPELPQDNRVRTKKTYPVLSMKEVVRKIQEDCAPSEYFRQGVGKHYVVILPEAWEELKMMIGWGKRTPSNVYEQIYEGMGYCFDNGEGKWILVITHFLYIYAANRSPVSACISNGVHDSILARLEYEREIYCKNEAKYNKSPEGYKYNAFVGEQGPSYVNLYGHTHPDIGVFFSHDDRTSGFATPDFPAATFVADPIRKQVKAMVGIGQEDAQVVVFEYKKTATEKKAVKECIDIPVIKEKKLNNDRRKTAEELVIELGRTCNELLNPIYGSTGNYVAKTTFTGKEHIKVDIKLSPKVEAQRVTNPLFSTRNEGVPGGYDAYV